MGSLYLAALIVGGGTILLQLFMSGHGDGDADADADGGDHDLSGVANGDAAGHGGADHGGDGHHAADGFLPIFLSLRFWTFGLMAFGMVGALLHYLALIPLLAVPAAAGVVGLGSGWLASWTFRALSRAGTQSGTYTRDAVGKVGRVLVSATRERRGKVRIDLGGSHVDYIASTDEEQIAEGEMVLVEEVRGTEVHVSRAPEELLLDRRNEDD